MVTKEMKIAAKEMNELLKYIVPNEYASKIPQKFRNFLKEIEDKEYIFNIDINKDIDEQDITEKTKDLITVIYRNYWCSREEKENIDKILTENEIKYQEELRKKYNPDNLLKKQKEVNSDSSENLSMIEYKSNIIFDKIKNFIKYTFRKLQIYKDGQCSTKKDDKNNNEEKAKSGTEERKEFVDEYINDDFFTGGTDDYTTISKVEYNNLKLYEKEFIDFFGYSDFVLKITKGSLIPIGNQNYDKDIIVELAEYDNDRIDIEIYNENEYSIFIKGKEYKLENREIFNRIKAFVSSKIDTLIEWSMKQNKENLDQNAYEGGIVRHIKVKYGNLILNINGQVSDIGDLCDEFIDNISKIIFNENITIRRKRWREIKQRGFLDGIKIDKSLNKQYTYIYLQNPDDESKIISVCVGPGWKGPCLSWENLINLEVVNIKDLDYYSDTEKYYYKGFTICFEHERDTWELWANIIGNYDIDIEHRVVDAGSFDHHELSALSKAMDVIDEAILKNESKTKKDTFIDAMQLPNYIKRLSRKEQNRVLYENIRNINAKLGNSNKDLEYNLNKEQRTIKNNVMRIINNKEFLEAYYQIIDFVDKKENNAELSNAEKIEVFTLIKMLYNNLLIEFEEELDEILYEKGNKYYFGKGVEKDYKKAFEIFKDLADNKEHLRAMEFLCTMYYYGKGTDVNYELARKYCENVEQKNSECDKNIFQFLGEIYFEGLGIEPDYIKAKAYFEKALVDDYDDTYYKLGLLNSGNYGFPKNEEKANEYFNKIEKDLLLAIIYLLLAIKPEEEQNLEGIYKCMEYSRDEYTQIFTNNIPFDHPAAIYYKKVGYLQNEEYGNIVNRLKEKIEWCLQNEIKIEKGIFTFENENDVNVYADTVVNFSN